MTQSGRGSQASETTSEPLETTRDKVNRLFKQETLARMEREGLMVVDKADFQIVMDRYFEVNALRKKVRELEAKVGKPT